MIDDSLPINLTNTPNEHRRIPQPMFIDDDDDLETNDDDEK